MIVAKKYFKPTSIEQAISMANKSVDSCCYLAGGTDVMVNKFQENNAADLFIDISEIAALKDISSSKTQLCIGALVCLDDLKINQDIAIQFPILLEAANSIASPTIRKTATIGGNLLCENRCIFYNQSEWWREAAGYCLKCNGPSCLASGGNKKCFSKFVSDMAVALISLHASIEVIDKKGISNFPLEDIYTGDGVHPRQLNTTAIIKSIHIPLHKNFTSVYKKLRKRETLDFTSLTTAVSLQKNGLIRIVLGGVHAKPVIVDGSSDSHEISALIEQVTAMTRIIDNDTYARAYRKEMIPVFLNRSFRELKLC